MTIDPEFVQIEDLEFTEQVSTGGRIAISYNVFAQSGATPPPAGQTVFQNPDYCIASDLGGGVRLSHDVYIEGDLQDSISTCWPMENRQRRATFDFIAPSQDGSYTIAIQLVGMGSGEVAETVEFEVQVGSDGNGGTTTCPDGFVRDPDTGNCVTAQDPDGGGGGSDDPLQDTEDIVRLGVLGLGAIAVIRGIGLLEGD